MGKAENTRFNILTTAFNAIYQHGYQATSIDDIIEQTDVTKGAFYYHFKNKESMGVAVMLEVIYPGLYKSLIEPLEHSDDPIVDIYEVIERFMLDTTKHQIKFGCPTNNIIQEMAPLSESFRKPLLNTLKRWQETIAKALERGKSQGKVAEGVDADAASQFIVAGYEGARSLGKVFQNKTYYKQYLSQLKNYLESLS
ncbi:MAG: TetR/AcrR family transcriptional regulator [Bacteroidota bacterium]